MISPNPPRTAEAADEAGSADLARARRVFAIEGAALEAIAARLDASFTQALDLMHACRGKVVVTGMGKSGIIGRKIAATLTSTGTPALFLHAAEAAHGDAGVSVKGDVVIALSTSGETEVIRLLPLIKRLGLPLIAMTGNPDSTLGRAADVVLDVGISEEACPMGLAPTASTTATLVMGDALAVALLERKGFGPDDFAVLHPAGALGRRFLAVRDLMHTGAGVPIVHEHTPLREAILEMTGKRLGVTAVTDDGGRLIGVITDGDLRRVLERAVNVDTAQAAQVMSRGPKTIEAEALAARAVAIMEQHSITSLFCVDPADGRPLGVIHLHDLLKAGVV